MRNILTMVRYDLRQKLMDGSVLAFAVLVPLALMFVMNLVFGGATNIELKPVTVAVSAPADDDLAAVVPAVLGSIPETSGMRITVTDAAADQVSGMVDDGSAGMGVVLPDDFAATLLGGEGPEVEVIIGDDVGITGQVVYSIIDSTLAQITAGAQAADAAIALGAPLDQVASIAQAAAQDAPEPQWREGETASEQLNAEESVVAGQAGMFLLFTVGFGVLALVTERGQGTLARLMSMPMPHWLITVAKALVSFILGLASTTVLLTAGTTMFGDVDFGSPLAVAVLVVLVVTATTSLMFIIAKVARTAEQASIAQAIVAIALGMSGGAFFPINSTGFVGTLLALNPVKSFTNGLGITAGGGGVGDLGGVAMILLGFTAVSLLIAWLIPDRKDAL